MWLSSFLCQHPEQLNTESGTEVCQNPQDELQLNTCEDGHTNKKGLFVDSFRYFHPDQKNAFTCWSTATGARQTNYGTRIDYILADHCLVEKTFIDSVLLPEVEGSDHCPVMASLNCRWLASPKCPAFCTKYMPEFAGKQQKLSQFVVKIDKKVSSPSAEILPNSQDSSEITENLVPLAKPKPSQSTQKRTGTNPGRRNNKKMKTEQTGHGTLLSFFKPSNIQNKGSKPEEGEKIPKSKPDDQDTKGTTQNTDGVTDTSLSSETTPCSLLEKVGEVHNKAQAAFWKSVLKGLPPPPNCHNHKEPCVLRTVKKPGPNCGRQFYVCARPEGHSSNPDARCNTFIWVTKIK